MPNGTPTTVGATANLWFEWSPVSGGDKPRPYEIRQALQIKRQYVRQPDY